MTGIPVDGLAVHTSPKREKFTLTVRIKPDARIGGHFSVTIADDVRAAA